MMIVTPPELITIFLLLLELHTMFQQEVENCSKLQKDIYLTHKGDTNK